MIIIMILSYPVQVPVVLEVQNNTVMTKWQQ